MILPGLLGFVAALALIFVRVPIGIALAVVGFGGFYLLKGLTPALSMIAIAAKDSSMSYALSVIPLFVLMGNLIAAAGISADLFRAAQMLMGRMRGGLALATVLSCGGFAAVCGSSVATAYTMGKVSLPSMKRYGYSDSLATASVAAGGTLGIIIPPSVIMVIYGIATETHIGKLFAAGLIPGLLGILGYFAAIRWTVWRNPASAPLADPVSRDERMDAYRRVWPVILLFGVVLGGIYGGLFTATEAAGVGATGGFLFALVRGRLGFAQFYNVFLSTLETSAVMFAIVLGANIFGEFMNMTGLDTAVLKLVKGHDLQPITVIFIIIAIYVVLGALMEELSMILLTLPVFFPLVVGLGYDPVWFGILVVVLCQVGLIAPPIGMNLFVIKAVAPDVSLATTIQGISPFIVADVLRVALLAVFPVVTLVLPNLLFK
ncbi:TRAP transporter large permease [Ramlibacter sp.]|uniref:TRAP transporter large permease n=1 Tax=Ramlibacter sp. TaxID=1917967 RepID=UPI0035ADBAB3